MLEAINTWDDSFMTFGVFQWTDRHAGALILASCTDQAASSL
jgi:hypothetical protein